MKPVDLLAELELRSHVSDADLMRMARHEIIVMRDACRRRGKLLADIFNYDHIDLPADLNNRIERMLRTGTDEE